MNNQGQLVIDKHGRGVELGFTEKKTPAKWLERDLNPQPPEDYRNTQQMLKTWLVDQSAADSQTAVTRARLFSSKLMAMWSLL